MRRARRRRGAAVGGRARPPGRVGRALRSRRPAPHPDRHRAASRRRSSSPPSARGTASRSRPRRRTRCASGRRSRRRPRTSTSASRASTRPSTALDRVGAAGRLVSAPAVDRDFVRGLLLAPARARAGGRTAARGHARPRRAAPRDRRRARRRRPRVRRSRSSTRRPRRSSARPPTPRSRTSTARSRARAEAFDTSAWSTRSRAPRALPAPAPGRAARRARDAPARPRRRDRLRRPHDVRRPARPADREARLLRGPGRELRVRHAASAAARSAEGNWFFREPLGVVAVITPWNIPSS